MPKNKKETGRKNSLGAALRHVAVANGVSLETDSVQSLVAFQVQIALHDPLRPKGTKPEPALELRHPMKHIDVIDGILLGVREISKDVHAVAHVLRILIRITECCSGADAPHQDGLVALLRADFLAVPRACEVSGVVKEVRRFSGHVILSKL